MISVKFFLLYFAFIFPLIDAISSGYHDADNELAKQIVSLRSSKGHICGGAILHSRLIITAAHCFQGLNKIKHVVVGSRRLDETNQKYELEKFIVHPSYNPLLHKGDIALVYLRKALNLTEFLSLDAETKHAGAQCLTLGWGRVAMPGPLADELVFANFTIAPPTHCFASSTFTKGQLCFHDIKDGSKGVSEQDEGGPIICHDSITAIISYTVYPSKILHTIAMLLGIIVEPAKLQTISYATDLIYYTDWILKEADQLTE